MARFFAFFTLFHLSLTFFRPEVPFKYLQMHLGIPFRGKCTAKSVIHCCLNYIYCVQTAILPMSPHM